MIEDLWANTIIINLAGEWSLNFEGESHDDHKAICKAICKYGYCVQPNNRITLKGFARLIKKLYPNDEFANLYINILNKYSSPFMDK